MNKEQKSQTPMLESKVIAVAEHLGTRQSGGGSMSANSFTGSTTFGWTPAFSVHLLQAAHFASNFDDFCERILTRTFSQIGFDSCLIANLVEQRLATCAGYYNMTKHRELDKKHDRVIGLNSNLIEINLDQELMQKISDGEPHWKMPTPNSNSNHLNSAMVLGVQSQKISLFVPFPVFCGEVGFLLLGSQKEKLTRAITSAEINFLQWILATHLLISRARSESSSTRSSTLGILTIRQGKIYDFLISGLTNAQIARQLNVSISTVKAEVGVIYSRIGVRKRSELRDKHEF